MSEEQKRNYQKDLDRFEEEKFASRNSFPTKLLGWMLIASFGFQVAGAISSNNHYLGKLFFLFAGIYVLNGSQSALRFATFFIAPAAVLGLLRIIWSIALKEPVEINGAWTDYRELKFWTLGVSPYMYLLAGSMVATWAFRLRRIPYWTTPVRWLTVIAGALLLWESGLFIRDLIRAKKIRHSLTIELASARGNFHDLHAAASSASIVTKELTFAHFPNVRSVNYEVLPGIDRWSYQNESFVLPGNRRLHKYQEWWELGSGEWGRIEMEVILPEDPR